jgi:formate/nitrite transporter FocA (FNT family)
MDANSFWTASLSALAAGALMTLMTWLVEGAESMEIRILCGWLVGFLLAAAALNHVIVGAAEMFFGIRYGAALGWGDYVGNLAVAGVGNVIGGVLFVTLTRLGQAVGSSK